MSLTRSPGRDARPRVVVDGAQRGRQRDARLPAGRGAQLRRVAELTGTSAGRMRAGSSRISTATRAIVDQLAQHLAHRVAVPLQTL